MSRIGVLILAVLAIAALGLTWARERRLQARLAEQIGTVQQLESQTARLTADNQALSNSVIQFRRAQAEANQQFQELVRVRAETG
jgi:hypothetical protein